MKKQMVHIRSVNLSKSKGEVKVPVPEILLSAKGIEGDAHAGPWHRQVSLLAAESIQTYESATGTRVPDGGFGENITTEGFVLHHARPLDRFTCGDVVLELTQVGKNGQFAGRNVLKHMVDSMMELTVEDDPRSDLHGCRVLTMTKNRFGGAGHRYFLDLKGSGFRVVAKLSA